MTIQQSMMCAWASSFLVATGCLVAEYHFSRPTDLPEVSVQNSSSYIHRSDFLQHQKLITFDASPLYHIEAETSPQEEVKPQRTTVRKKSKRRRGVLRAVPPRPRRKPGRLKQKRTYTTEPLVGNGAQMIAGGMKVKPAKALAEWKKVRKEARFSWPVEPRDFWVSSLYGPRRNPNGRIAFHAGVDMAAQKGTIVHAAGEGVVTEACYATGYGNYIMITHTGTFKTRYAHLDKIFDR